MTSYRFPPAKMTGPFFAVLGVTVLVLGAPAVLSLALPAQKPELEEVVLDDPEWRQPVEGLMCSANYDSMANQAWDCGDTLVEAYVTQGVDDDALALRRAVRATTFGSLPEEDDVTDHDGILTLSVDGETPIFAFSVPKGDLNYQIVASEGEPAQVAEQVMEAFQ